MAQRRESAKELFSRQVTPEQYEEIRALWNYHAQVEEGRDLDALISTLTEDCEYSLVATNERWYGHKGAYDFYEMFFTALPDATFELTDCLFGPQGALEIAFITATHRGVWSGVPASGRVVRFESYVFFPWDPVQRKFKGERFFYDQLDLMRQMGALP